MANFSQMYEQYVEQVYYFLRELSGDEEITEKLVQKTFYLAFLHVDSFENRGSVLEWLCEIGETLYQREMKRRKQFEGNFPEQKQFEGKRQSPAFEGEMFGEEVSAAERKKRIRRGLRRIRRRWVCSVMAVAAVILSMLVGVMLIMGGLRGN